jgi:transglutaminase-like putative cysteine protease
MTSQPPSLAPYLAASPVIDCDQAVAAASVAPTTGLATDAAMAEALFTFARDAISRSADARQNPITCVASDVLAHGTGFCYAKCHLLAALLADLPDLS